MSYVLDANVFIQAKRRFYAFDICPGYWNSLVWHERQGNLCSIDRVADELRREGDELSRWRLNLSAKGPLCRRIVQRPVSRYADLIRWVQTQSQFLDYAKEQFAKVADGWLVAYAKSTHGIVVTLEEFDPVVKRRIPLPNICRAFDVEHVTPFEMLRRLNVQLSWQAPA